MFLEKYKVLDLPFEMLAHFGDKQYFSMFFSKYQDSFSSITAGNKYFSAAYPFGMPFGFSALRLHVTSGPMSPEINGFLSAWFFMTLGVFYPNMIRTNPMSCTLGDRFSAIKLPHN